MSRSYAVIGAGFGDEGKGLVTDYLCNNVNLHPDKVLVVRYSGGQQAGHTVCIEEDGVRHVFSNFGSGTLRGTPTCWSRFCTVDPVGLVNEAAVLADKGIEPKLYIDPRCPITTPYDKYHNQNDPDMLQNGTCGVGVGATWTREKANYRLRYEDLFNLRVFEIKLQMIREWYGKYDEEAYQVSTQTFKDCCAALTLGQIGEPGQFWDLESNYDNIVFEGSQGLLLDQSIGFFPHVTRGHVGSENILDLGQIPEVYLVTRAYQTRHGHGPMTNEGIPHNITLDPRETNENNEYQGAFRRSLLDLDLLKYAIRRDHYINAQKGRRRLVITCLDHVDEDGYRFTNGGDIVECEDSADFAMKVAERLNFSRVLISRSPYSRYLKPVQELTL